MQELYDIIIVGGGPAGVSAALTGLNRGKTVAVIANGVETGSLYKAELVTNYPGLAPMSGEEMCNLFHRQLKDSAADLISGRALNVMPMGDIFGVAVGNDFTQCRALIIAAGITRENLYPGEAEYLGRGVSYCATCDGMLYRGKSVAVLGYSDTARGEADFLRSIGCSVTYFDRPRACVINGENQVESLTCDGETIRVDGVFLLRPTMAPTDLFPGLETENGYVTVNRKMATNLPGLFAAGDCTGGPLQVSKAAGEGLVAGQSAAAWAAEQSRKSK